MTYNAIQMGVKEEIQSLSPGGFFSMVLRRQFKRPRNLKLQSLQSIKNEDTREEEWECLALQVNISPSRSLRLRET
jgi:hypothetical protein